MNELLISTLERTPLPIQIAFLLHYHRIAHADFAGKLGVTSATLSNWLTGRIRPNSGKYFHRMAILLDCPPGLLYKGSSGAFPPGIRTSSDDLIRQRRLLNLSCGEVSRFIRITDSQLYKWEKEPFVPDPYGSVLAALYTLLSEDSFSRKQNLSKLRIQAGLSVHDAALRLCVPEKNLLEMGVEQCAPAGLSEHRQFVLSGSSLRFAFPDRSYFLLPRSLPEAPPDQHRNRSPGNVQKTRPVFLSEL